MNLTNKQTKEICLKYMNAHNILPIEHMNKSKYVIENIFFYDRKRKVILIYDSYTDVLNDIYQGIEDDLDEIGRYKKDFYLTLQDMNALELYEYIVIKKDISKLIEDMYNS